jgi:hypothetical protein
MMFYLLYALKLFEVHFVHFLRKDLIGPLVEYSLSIEKLKPRLIDNMKCEILIHLMYIITNIIILYINLKLDKKIYKYKKQYKCI